MANPFSRLTRTAVISPDTGQPQYVDNPQQMASVMRQQDIPLATATLPDAIVQDAPAGSNFRYAPDTSFQSDAITPVHTMQPTYKQATIDPATQMEKPALMNPALTKAGKLVNFLQVITKGAMAGRAADEQAVAQSGGHRSGGFATGFEAAEAVPYQEAARRQNATAAAIQNQAGQLQNQQAGVNLQLSKRRLDAMKNGMNFDASVKSLGDLSGDEQALISAAQQESMLKGDSAPLQQAITHIASMRSTFGRTQSHVNLGPLGIWNLSDPDNPRQYAGTSPAQVTIDDAMISQYGIPQEFRGQTMTSQQLAPYIRLQFLGSVPVQGAAGPALVNRTPGANYGKVTPLGLGSPGVAAALARPYDMQDPASGVITPVPAGVAMGVTAPSPVPGTIPPRQQRTAAQPNQAQTTQPQPSPAARPVSAKNNLQKNAFTPMARFDDIARSVNSVNASLPALDSNNTQRGLIFQALSDPEAKQIGATKAFMLSKAYKELNPQSRNYVTGILSLREQIMGANQMLTGSAGTSDSRVQAIWNTLPNGTEPDSDMARRKMEQVHGMINNLKEAFPLVDVVRKAQDAAKTPPANRPPLSSFWKK